MMMSMHAEEHCVLLLFFWFGCRFAVKQPALDFQEQQPEELEEEQQVPEAGAAAGQAGKVRQPCTAACGEQGCSYSWLAGLACRIGLLKHTMQSSVAT
jgi:hypothetical protein